MPQHSASQIRTYLILLVVTLVVTTTVAILMKPGSAFSEKYLISFGFVVIAELVTFGAVIREAIAGRTDSAVFAFFIGRMSIVTLYDLAVLCLVILAFSGISYQLLLSFHLVALLIFFILAGASHEAGKSIAGIIDNRRRQRNTILNIRRELDLAVSDLSRIPGGVSCDVMPQLQKIQEQLRYSSSESLPGVEHHDQTLLDNTIFLRDKIRVSSETRRVEALAEELLPLLQKITSASEERETMIKGMR